MVEDYCDVVVELVSGVDDAGAGDVTGPVVVAVTTGVVLDISIEGVEDAT